MNRFPGNAAKHHKRNEPSCNSSIQFSKERISVAMRNFPHDPQTRPTVSQFKKSSFTVHAAQAEFRLGGRFPALGEELILPGAIVLAKSVLNCSLPRDSRDITVPMGMSRVVAISL